MPRFHVYSTIDGSVDCILENTVWNVLVTSSSWGPGVLLCILGKRILKNDSYFLSVLNTASLVLGLRLGREMKMGLRGWGVDWGGCVLEVGFFPNSDNLEFNFFLELDL